MSPEREEICRNCKKDPSINPINHRGALDCDQPACFRTKEEYEQAGINPSDRITPEGVRKLMELTLRPECMERLLAYQSLERWAEDLAYGRY